MSRPPEITFTDDQEVNAALFQRAFDWVYGQLRAAQAKQPDVARALADLQANGLTRIASTLGPVYEDAVRIADHLQLLEGQFLGEGVVPAILAQAAASVDGKLLLLGNDQDAQLAAYAGLAAAMFAAKTHAHAISDVAGLADALAASRPALIERFETSGTWQKRDGLVAAYVVAIGGGGGGGSGVSITDNSTYQYGGGGGGGGGYTAVMLQAAMLNATEAVQIGAGGIGAAPTGASGQPGGGGGATSFGDRIRAGGGSGGSAGVVNGGTGIVAVLGGGGTFGGGAGGGVGSGSSGFFIPGGSPNGHGAGGGGPGGSRGDASGGLGGICAAHGGTSPTAAAGLTVPSWRHGGGGGAGGGASQPGFAGGGPGGGGGGGGAGAPGVNNNQGARGGDGARGALFILNLF